MTKMAYEKGLDTYLRLIGVSWVRRCAKTEGLSDVSGWIEMSLEQNCEAN